MPDSFHSQPDIGPVTIPEVEEHAHIGADEQYPGYKLTYAPPVAYKAFPSLASGYIYHCVAPVGTASGASLWRVMREIKLTGTIEWAGGQAAWINSLASLPGLTYS